MMEALSRYILSVIAGAFIVSILDSILDKKSGAGALMRLLGGIFIVFTIISPIVRLDFSGIADYFEEYSLEGESAAAWGESLADETYRGIIKSRTEAYILDKADELGAVLTVEVTLSDDETPVPEEAALRGKISPYARTQLQQMMEAELGIAKENQLWIG